jgi:hypothetical protein
LSCERSSHQTHCHDEHQPEQVADGEDGEAETHRWEATEARPKEQQTKNDDSDYHS